MFLLYFSFRNGHLNVLVCTDILEEGIDISYCNLVVKFDMVKSFRSYVQSKGRARHQSSFFCLMVNTEESETYQKKLHYFNEIEEYLETVSALIISGHELNISCYCHSFLSKNW